MISWTAARQASLSITNSQSLLKLMFIALVMPSKHLILCRPLLLSPSIFPSIRVFSNDLQQDWAQWWFTNLKNSLLAFPLPYLTFPWHYHASWVYLPSHDLARKPGSAFWEVQCKTYGRIILESISFVFVSFYFSVFNHGSENMCLRISHILIEQLLYS